MVNYKRAYSTKEKEFLDALLEFAKDYILNVQFLLLWGNTIEPTIQKKKNSTGGYQQGRRESTLTKKTMRHHTLTDELYGCC